MDHIVLGISVVRNQEKLLQESDLTLEKAVSICDVSESSSVKQKEIIRDAINRGWKTQQKGSSAGWMKRYEMLEVLAKKNHQQVTYVHLVNFIIVVKVSVQLMEDSVVAAKRKGTASFVH